MNDKEFVKSIYPGSVCRIFNYQFESNNRIEYDIVIPGEKNIALGLNSESEAWLTAKKGIIEIVFHKLNY